MKIIAIPAGPVAEPKIALRVRNMIKDSADQANAESKPKNPEPISETRKACLLPYRSASFPAVTAKTANPRLGPVTTQRMRLRSTLNSSASSFIAAAKTETIKLADTSPRSATQKIVHGEKPDVSVR